MRLAYVVFRDHVADPKGRFVAQERGFGVHVLERAKQGGDGAIATLAGVLYGLDGQCQKRSRIIGRDRRLYGIVELWSLGGSATW